MISPGVFFIFVKFWFFGLLGGKKGKKWPKIKNKYICHMPYLRNSTAYDHAFCYTIVKWWYLQVVFSFFFFFILIFQAVREVKKNSPKLQNILSVARTSQESYIIWLSFVVHLCEIMIFPGIFSFFKILIFCVVGGVKGEKMVQNEKKIMYFVVHTSKNIHHIIFIYGTQG